MEHITEFIMMSANGVLTLMVSYAGWKLRKHYDAAEAQALREKARDRLQLSTSRLILLRECEHWLRLGRATLGARDAVTGMYAAYHAFGGNGAVTDIYERFMALPPADA